MKTGINENVFFEPQSIVKDLFNFNFCLTYLSSMFEFYTPRKRQKTKAFLKFSGGIEMENWGKMGWSSFNLEVEIQLRL